jgi:hypothetical protein
MIKFYCTRCDKKLGVPDEFAGKRVRCPRCKQPVTVPELEIEPVEEPMPDFLGSDDPLVSDHGSDIAPPKFDFPLQPETETPPAPAAQTPAPKKPTSVRCPKCLTVIPDGSEFCITCGHPAPMPAVEGEKDKPKKSGILRSIPMGKGFVTDLISMLSPMKSGSDMITFFVLFLMHLFVNAPIPIPFIGWIKLIIYGYIYTFLFDVLLETANGNNNLPHFEVPDNFGDLIRPYLQIIASSLCAFLPFLVWLVATIYSAWNQPTSVSDSDYSDTTVEQNEYRYDSESPVKDPNKPDVSQDSYGVDGSMGKPYEHDESASMAWMLPVGLFCAGMFFWPMIVLNIVLGNTYFPNPIKVFQNIGRAVKPYLICCGIMYLTSALIWLSIFKFTIKGILDGSSFILILGAISALVGSLYIEIYAMRALGLLYRHYEDRLDW